MLFFIFVDKHILELSLDDKRSRLAGDTVSKLLFMKLNDSSTDQGGKCDDEAWETDKEDNDYMEDDDSSDDYDPQLDL